MSNKVVVKAKPIQQVKSGLLYALVVFLVGFCLGTIRVLFVVPIIGVRWAEILEAPLMIVASFFAARYLLNLRGPFGRSQSFVIGLVALVFMAVAEISFVLAQSFSMSEYVASRDPISGTVYLFSLGVFALMPLILSLKS